MVSQHVHSHSVLNISAKGVSFAFVITVNKGGVKKKKLQEQKKQLFFIIASV